MSKSGAVPFDFPAFAARNNQLLLGLFCACVMTAMLAVQVTSGAMFKASFLGDQTRGIATDLMLNFCIHKIAMLYAFWKRFTLDQSATLVVILSVVSELISYFMDNALMHQRLSFYLMNKNIGPDGNPWVKEEGPFAILLDVVKNFGGDVGIRSFLMIMINFLITSQFEGAVRNSLSVNMSPLLPITIWWAITLLCASVTNIIRFEWAYCLGTRGRDVQTISVSSVILFMLVISLVYMNNSNVFQTPKFKLRFVVFMQLFVLAASSWGALNVPGKAINIPGLARVVPQLVCFGVVLYAIVFTAMCRMIAKTVDKAAPPAPRASTRRKARRSI